MLNFTKPFEQNRLVVRKLILSQWSNSTIICICTVAYEDYIIFLCLSSLPSILRCLHAFPTSKHDVRRLRNRLPNGTVYNAIFY